MKLLGLSAYFYPEQFASSYLWIDVGKAYAEEGFERVVCCPTPCRGVTKEVREEYKSKRNEYLYDGRLNVVRFPLFKEGKNTVFRAIRYFISSWYMFFWAVFSKKTKNCDVIVVGSTPPTQGALAATIKRIKKIPFVYNLQDVFPDSLVGTGIARKGGVLWKIGRMIENYTYKYADKIIVISEDFKKNLITKGVPEDKIVLIYNWVNASKITPISNNNNPLYEEFCIPRETFNVVYAGNLGNAQNVMLLVETAMKLKECNTIRFVIFGTGGQENELKSFVHNHNLNNVQIFPLQPAERVPYVYSLGDVCVVACKAGFGGSAMPSKTWSIMACGRTVLASFDDGELKHIIEDNNCGIFTEASEPDAFVKALLFLHNNPEKLKLMGTNGRRFVLENLTTEVGTLKYVNVIKSFEGKKHI